VRRIVYRESAANNEGIASADDNLLLSPCCPKETCRLELQVTRSPRHIDDDLMTSYIERTLPFARRAEAREHLDTCGECWVNWNTFRWRRARGSRGYLELKEYLGDDFQEGLDSSWALADEWRERNPKTKEEIERFYAETPYYVYNLLIWKESGQRPPYVHYALPHLRRSGAHRICDYGCGIGNDGLELLERGYEVVFCDFDNPSTRFLRWRIERRGLTATFIPPNEAENLKSFETLWAVDVIEHLPDPYGSLAPFLRGARTFVTGTEHDTKSHGRQPFHIQHPEARLVEFYRSIGFIESSKARELIIWQRTG